MSDKHPYMSGTAGITQAVVQLRKSFPAQVGADTLKKLAIAPNNETYVLNILRFIGVLDTEGKKATQAAKVFIQHEDEEFRKGFADLVSAGYEDLFKLHGNTAWSLATDKLIAFFRNSDHTSAIVGARQASTFQGLAVLSGKIEGGVASSVSLRSSHLSIRQPAADASRFQRGVGYVEVGEAGDVVEAGGGVRA